MIATVLSRPYLRRRAWLAAVIAALVLVLGGVKFAALDPALLAAQSAGQTWEGEVEELTAERDRLRQERTRVEQHRSQFQQLTERGFLAPPDRLAAGSLIERLATEHRLIGLRFLMGPQALVEDPKAHALGYLIHTTPLTVEARGYLDQDLLAFAAALVEELPGQAGLTRLAIERTVERRPGLLIDLARGKPVELVAATMAFDWRTLARISSYSGQRPPLVAEKADQ